MAKEAYYFPHDSNAQDDPKCMVLIDQLGMEGYGIFWALIERLRNETIYALPMSIIPSLARRWGTSKEKVETVIKKYDLFVVENGHFYSHRLKKSMDIKTEKARLSAAAKWGKKIEDAQPFEYSSTRSQRLSEARKKGKHKKEEWEEMRIWFKECVKCGSTDDIVKDHIIPIYQGGDDSISNLQPLCRTCNCSKGRDNQDYRISFCEKNACEMPAAWVQMPPKERKEKEIKGKESRGIKFSLDNTKVIFQDGTSQKLGESQLMELERNSLSPQSVIKGNSY